MIDRWAAILATTLLLCVSPAARAQALGHYIPGYVGLDDGTQAPPGVSLSLPASVYPTDTIKGDDGDTLDAHPNITTSFFGLGMAVVTNVRILGAHYGAQATPINFTKSRVESTSEDVNAAFHFTDPYVSPLWLGWNVARADFSVAYGFFAPVGKWELGGDDNTGLGMWSHDFQGGTTIHLDERDVWSTAVLATYETHSHKGDTDLRVGDILTFEGGTRVAFYPQGATPPIVNVGVAYYAQLKVTPDTGPDEVTSEILAEHEDRVFGIGAEGNIFFPKPNLLLDLRVLPEFEARNRTQGVLVVFTASWSFASFDGSAVPAAGP